MNKLLLALTILIASPVYATPESPRPFRYETSCALESKDDFLMDECVVIETREPGGVLRSRNIFSNRFGLSIKSRFDKEKGFMTWDSFNKFEYKFEYKVGGVDGLGAYTYVMPGFLLQNVSWD